MNGVSLNAITATYLGAAIQNLSNSLAAFALMRLTAGTFAGAQMPLNQSATQPFGLPLPGGFIPEPAAPPLQATMPQDGKASIDLGDGYTMTLNERSSEIVITDAEGNKTRIWGDPHVDVTGAGSKKYRAGDFYDTSTFELENGTKITINTEPWKKGGNGAYVASQVVVSTASGQGLVVDGISQNQLGDLKITTGLDGKALDFAHDDGFNMYEDDKGNGNYGWTSEFTGERVTRSEMKEMTLHKNRGMREALEADRDFTNMFTSWLVFGDIGALASYSNSETAEREVRNDIKQQVQALFGFLLD